jgi:DNA-binding response OmpR family regulator
LFFGAIVTSNTGAPCDAPTMRADVSPRGGLILVVEDEPLLRKLAERVLRRAGYEVTLAANGYEALAALGAQGRPPSAAYIDLVLPGMSGQELLVALRARHPTLPVLISTGGDASALPTEVFDAMTELLQKPYGVAELLASIERMTSGARATRASHPPAGPGVISIACKASDVEDIDRVMEEMRVLLSDALPASGSMLTRESVALTLLRAGIRAHDRATGRGA